MNANPYGAVPEALGQTRLTLRDIMSDYLQNKVLESNMRLAETKANTETALVNAGIEKERLAGERDLARMRLTRDIHDEEAVRQESQFGRSLAQTIQAQQDQNRIAQGQLNVSQGQLKVGEGHLKVAEDAEKRAAREEQRKNEVRTAGDWVKTAGLHPGLLDFVGADPGQKLRRADAELLYGNIQTMMKTNPSLGFMVHGYALKRDLLDLQDKIQSPGLTDDQRSALKKEYGGKLRRFEQLDQLIMAEKTPDQAKIVAEARKTYADTPELATKFPSFEQFLTEFSKNVTNARSTFHDDVKKLKELENATPGERPKQDAADMERLTSTFKAGTAPWQKITYQNAEKLVRKGRAQEALKYMRTMEKTYGGQSAPSATTGAAPAAASATKQEPRASSTPEPSNNSQEPAASGGKKPSIENVRLSPVSRQVLTNLSDIATDFNDFMTRTVRPLQQRKY